MNAVAAQPVVRMEVTIEGRSGNVSPMFSLTVHNGAKCAVTGQQWVARRDASGTWRQAAEPVTAGREPHVLGLDGAIPHNSCTLLKRLEQVVQGNQVTPSVWKGAFNATELRKAATAANAGDPRSASFVSDGLPLSYPHITLTTTNGSLPIRLDLQGRATVHVTYSPADGN